LAAEVLAGKYGAINNKIAVTALAGFRTRCSRKVFIY